MDDIHSIVVVEDEHDLERTARWGSAPHQPLAVWPLERVRLPRRHHDVLGLFGPHPVASDMLHIPVAPPKLGHTISYTRIRPMERGAAEHASGELGARTFPGNERGTDGLVLAEYQKAKGQDLHSRSHDCGPLPAKVDVHAPPAVALAHPAMPTTD